MHSFQKTTLMRISGPVTAQSPTSKFPKLKLFAVSPCLGDRVCRMMKENIVCAFNTWALHWSHGQYVLKSTGLNKGQWS